jgi:hypothetical protein
MNVHGEAQAGSGGVYVDLNNGDSVLGFDKPPFLYEIRVKGRLSSEQWTAWFDDLNLSYRKGESVLSGCVPDHAALYGLLARLRDLAIPLVAVRVLDEQAQRSLARQSRRYDLAINALMAGVYLALLGGLTAITVLVAPLINPALAIALLFAGLAGMAHAFWVWSGVRYWRWLANLAWPAAAITFAIYIPLSGVLPAALGIAILLFLIAGALVYLISILRRQSAAIRAFLPAPLPAAGPDEVNAAEIVAGETSEGETGQDPAGRAG